MRNVPDDWDNYWSKCSECGEKTHASDGHYCEPEEEEEEEERYTIRVWIPIHITDPDDQETMTYDEAESELKHLEFMHPENKYEIEEVEND